MNFLSPLIDREYLSQVTLLVVFVAFRLNTTLMKKKTTTVNIPFSIMFPGPKKQAKYVPVYKFFAQCHDL
jgi:hypothetical protein